MTKLSKSVLSKIQEEHVKPLPKEYFVFRNILWWGTFLLSVFLGAGGFAVVLFSIVHQRFDFLDLFQYGGKWVFFGMVPFFWIFFFGLFIWVSFWGIAHTKKAYRVPRFLLISVNILLSLILGTILYSQKYAERFEELIVRHVPYVRMTREAREDRWKKMVDRGLLAGEITEILSEDKLVLLALGEDKWTLDISEAKIHEGVTLEVGEKIGTHGEKTGDDTFKVLEIRPWDEERRPPRGKNGGNRPPRGRPGQLRHEPL